jgi:ATP-dependent DNA helicase RecG
MVNQDINDLLTGLNWEESESVEFKSVKGGFPKSIWETYSAMANTQGGTILLGVEDSGVISGISDISKIKKIFWDTINNRGKVNINLLTTSDVVDLQCSGNFILAIRIPRASRYQRPVYLNQNPLTGTYRRNHEGDYHCSEQEASRMLSDRSEDPIDSRILENFNLKDIDLLSLQQYRQRLSSYKPTHPWLSQDDVGLLNKLGGWRHDRKTGVEGLTLAGVLMFGRDETIREAIPTYHIDYQEKLSADNTIRWTDRLTIDGTWSANLFQFYIHVIQKLSMNLKLPFQLEPDLYRKGETEIHEAIREALVNSLIHADYLGVGGVLIEKYSDQFTFSNPGSLLISREQLYRGNVSECRNKALQTMFMMIGAAEKAGSGVDKIFKGWASQHWRTPLVREQTQPDRVCWELPMISLSPPESLKRLEQRFGNKWKNFSKVEVQALVTADIEGVVDNARMRQITNNHPADITRVLQELVGRGALLQEGQARGSRYRLPAEFNSVHKDSVHKDSVHKDSVHKDSVHKENSLSANELAHLRKISKGAIKNRRLAPSEMERIIVELCNDRWLSRKQLAELLERNPDGLRSRFLTSMVEHQRLYLRYPDKPNRVDQAYTSTKGLLS